ncbi:MAG: transporter substrate-binding domain-containing protein [Halioglobus sp.]
MSEPFLEKLARRLRMAKRHLLPVVVLLLGSVFSLSAPARTLKVGLSPQYPPLAYQQDGRYVGIEPDNAIAVGKIIGREVKLIEMPFTRLIPALNKGEIDVIMTGMSITEDRSQLVNFADPFLDIGQMGIVHVDSAARFMQPWSIYREGVRVGVEPGTTGALFAENELTDAKISFFVDPPAAFAGLRNKKIDMYIHDAPTSWLLATTKDGEDLISLYHALTEESLAWAVRKSDKRLLEDLNRALATMKAKGTLRYILNRWIPVQIQSQ